MELIKKNRGINRGVFLAYSRFTLLRATTEWIIHLCLVNISDTYSLGFLSVWLKSWSYAAETFNVCGLQGTSYPPEIYLFQMILLLLVNWENNSSKPPSGYYWKR